MTTNELSLWGKVRWRLSRKRRHAVVNKANELGLFEGDPNYYLKDAATLQEWLHLLDHISEET